MDMGSGRNGTSKVATAISHVEFSEMITEPMLVRRLTRLEEDTRREECYFPNRAEINPPIILPIRDTNPPYLLHIFRVIRHRDIQGFLWFQAHCITADGAERLLGSLSYKAEGTRVRVSVRPQEFYAATALTDDDSDTSTEEG